MKHEMSLALGNELDVQTDWLQMHHIITDRGSKYSVTVGRVTNNAELKSFLQTIKTNKKYAKATHNTYAARVTKDAMVYDIKNDDGETGAGMVILRIMVKRNITNACIVVTRWFGGTKLQADRYKHVQNATISVIEELVFTQ